MARKNWISAVAAGAALMIASPVLAADAPAQGAESAGAVSASSAANAGAATAKKAKATKYCFTADATTGSRIARKVCQTKAQWAKEGIDVDAELRRAE